jgi:hypothetical protein
MRSHPVVGVKALADQVVLQVANTADPQIA